MKRNESASKRRPVSKTCIFALGIAGLFVADEVGQRQMNWILGVFVLAVIAWAAFEMINAMDDQN